MSKPKLLFFTGAGISAESGLQTFRDSKNGFWNTFKIEEVCTPAAWEKNPTLVLDFYNQRRKQCKEAIPNLAHELIAKLETLLTFFPIRLVAFLNISDSEIFPFNTSSTNF